MMDQPKREAYFNHLISHPDDALTLRTIKQDMLQETADTRLYKYCGLGTGAKILDSGLFLQSPDNFNDPFDCLTGVGVWDSSSRFAAEPGDVRYACSVIGEIPKKYQLPQHKEFSDMRSSYCFAISCFAERWDQHLVPLCRKPQRLLPCI
jgi:hypothetical protein